MNECSEFSRTLKVGSCGDKLWIGIYSEPLPNGIMILVTYYLNGDEISDFFTPIREGNNVFLDMNEPNKDFFNSFNTYYISLTDVSGYYSNGTPLTNEGTLHNGFIVNFSTAKNGVERLITV
jgi:hypothetical protein